MNCIKILPPHEAQKIAAGEVVERPAHVLKELIENALDAKAKQICVYVMCGGKELLRVVDDGVGMSSDDARMCIVPYATSKLTSIDELSSLLTCGFRGEALASIAAVSAMKLITKHRDSDQAVCLHIRGGVIEQESVAAANNGTDVTIEDLLYNVPARKKFLKSDKAEWGVIQQLVHAYAFAYPSISFALYHNQQLTLQCSPVASMLERAQQLFHTTETEQLRSIDASYKGVSITGYISSCQFHRFDRSHIYFFVNNRWVKNAGLAMAVMRGYQEVLPRDQFPSVAIAINLCPSQIDINVHPRKEEILFADQRLVEGFLQRVVQDALGKMVAGSVSTTEQFSAKIPISSPPLPVDAYNAYQQPSVPENTWTLPGRGMEVPLTAMPRYENIALPSRAEGVFSVMPMEKLDEQKLVAENFGEEQGIVIGQLKKMYIVIERADGLWLMDQHAAHERILYEKLNQKFDAAESIRLLFPVTVQLSGPDFSCVQDLLPLLQKQGIDIEPWSQNSVLIAAAPLYIKPALLSELIHECVGVIKECGVDSGEEFAARVDHAVRAVIACKAAVKANDVLTMEQMRHMVTQLSGTENRFSCPHGRPTMWQMNWYALERVFKRVT